MCETTSIKHKEIKSRINARKSNMIEKVPSLFLRLIVTLERLSALIDLEQFRAHSDYRLTFECKFIIYIYVYPVY